MPTASDEPAERHHVERLPERARADDRTRGSRAGSDVTTMSVLRQLPRKRRIISAVRPAAMRRLLDHASTAARTKSD